jgi:hypothetical protein
MRCSGPRLPPRIAAIFVFKHTHFINRILNFHPFFPYHILLTYVFMCFAIPHQLEFFHSGTVLHFLPSIWISTIGLNYASENSPPTLLYMNPVLGRLPLFLNS